MQISTPDKSDYEEIVAIWEKSVRATHDFLAETDIAFFRPLILNEFLPAVDLRCSRDAAGRMTGFIGVAEGNIEMLFLDPAHMGKGIGRQLLDYAIAEMGARTVDVNEQNPNALAFYKHCGFTVTGRSPVEGMGKPYPLIHMERT